jgi:alkanesulfonate monooxygenase SsuD/methylene tetrahydromethanopterin reductase-like flavin-dependent oxidoreductase (luciferase family)
MASGRVSFGLTLPNRGVMFGATTPAQMLELAEMAESSGCFDSVWVGDSIIAKPRLESVALLTAVAARTRRVKLGPACFASFPLRHPILLAYQWASLDLLSEGRTIMVACMGGGSKDAGGDFVAEFRAMGVPVGERAARMEEGITILRRLWSEDHVSMKGRFYELNDVTVAPRPAQQSLPIWIANNPQVFQVGEQTLSRAADRVARLADGWQTTMLSPAGFAEAWQRVQTALGAHGRDPRTFPNSLYFNVHVGEDRKRTYEESKKFIDMYYMTDFPRETVDMWIAHGSVQQCADYINQFIDAGVEMFTLRLTSWDQKGQFRRVVDDLMPRISR